MRACGCVRGHLTALGAHCGEGQTHRSDQLPACASAAAGIDQSLTIPERGQLLKGLVETRLGLANVALGLGDSVRRRPFAEAVHKTLAALEEGVGDTLSVSGSEGFDPQRADASLGIVANGQIGVKLLSKRLIRRVCKGARETRQYIHPWTAVDLSHIHRPPQFIEAVG